MKAFFTHSFRGKGKYQNNYNLIHSAILDLGIDLTTPASNSYQQDLYELAKKRGIDIPIPITSPYDERLKDIQSTLMRQYILKNDVFIVENTMQSFKLGMEVSYAIEKKIPTLVLSGTEDISQFIENKYFFGAKYSKYNIKSCLKEFLHDSSRKVLSKRFNMYISEDQYEYLLTASQKNAMNISEYIRLLIDRDNGYTNQNTELSMKTLSPYPQSFRVQMD